MSWSDFAKISQVEKSLKASQETMKNMLNAILINQGNTNMHKVISATEYSQKTTGWQAEDTRLVYGRSTSSVIPTIEVEGAGTYRDIIDSRKIKLLQNLDEEINTSDIGYIHYDKTLDSYFICVQSTNSERVPSNYFMVKVNANDLSITKKEVQRSHYSYGKVFETDQQNLYIITNDSKLLAIRKSDLVTLWEKTGLSTNQGFVATCDEQDIVLFREASYSSNGEIVALDKTNGVQVWSNQTTSRPYRIGDMVLTPEGKAILWGAVGSTSGFSWYEWDTTTPEYTTPATFAFQDSRTTTMASFDSYKLSKDGKFGLGVRENNYIFAFRPKYEGYEPAAPPNVNVGELSQINSYFNPSSTGNTFYHVFLHDDYLTHGGLMFTYNSTSRLMYIEPFDIAPETFTIEHQYRSSELETDKFYLTVGNHVDHNGIRAAYYSRGRNFCFENGKIVLGLHLNGSPAIQRNFLVLDTPEYNNQASIYYAHQTLTQAPADLKIWAYAEMYGELNEGELWYSFIHDESKRPQEKLVDEHGEKNYEEILESGQRLQLSNREFELTVSANTNSVRINNALQQEILWVSRIYLNGKLLPSQVWKLSRDDNRTLYFDEEIVAGSTVKAVYDLKFINPSLPLYIHSKLNEADKTPPVLHELLLAYEI